MMCKLMLVVAVVADDIFIQSHKYLLKKTAREVRIVSLRKKLISSTIFNVNVRTEEASIRYFRLTRKAIQPVTKLIGWIVAKQNATGTIAIFSLLLVI